MANRKAFFDQLARAASTMVWATKAKNKFRSLVKPTSSVRASRARKYVQLASSSIEGLKKKRTKESLRRVNIDIQMHSQRLLLGRINRYEKAMVSQIV